MIPARLLTGLGLGALCAAGMLAAALEMLLVPLYAGKTLVPLTVALAVLINVALPLLARSIVPSGAAALAPFGAWLLVVVVVGLFPRPEGDVILPGGGAVEWVGYGVLLGGTVAGTVTVVLSGSRPAR
ncbi:MAG: hypothetical protein QOE97_53 [Pseudonocardiales bacterium]|jgi:hypothetical protein|nr:hypothetical protein [Pseudonocardiales bacterium]